MADDEAANAALIERFYSAFARKDGVTMAACYAPDARFSDPAFGELDGDQVRAMWRMFCEGEGEIEVGFSDVETSGDSGSARWWAEYEFPATGRGVRNEIEASFRFRYGLIAEHDDRFDFWRWTRQALGPVGLLLGWSPLVRGKVRSQARERLDEYMVAEQRGAGTA